MTPEDSQELESYVPVYDVVPKTWEDGSVFLVEWIKRLAFAINAREIGFFIDQEVLTGKSFIPGTNNVLDGGTSQTFRSILRKVVVFPGLTPGINTQPHGVVVDANYEQTDLWACATNSSAPFTSTVFGNSDTIRVVGQNVIITSDGTYDRCKAYLEYTQEQ